MSNYIAIVENNVFLIGNITGRGFIICIVAGSFCASFQLTNMCVAPVSNITDTAHPWVLIGKYKRPHCILMMLNSG